MDTRPNLHEPRRFRLGAGVRPRVSKRSADDLATMMVQAMLLLPRLVVTPPARLVVPPPHRTATPALAGPIMQLGKDGGAREQQLVTISSAQAHSGSLQTATRDSDREKVLAEVQQNGLVLGYASRELQQDRQVVLAAVQQHGEALRFAPSELQADRQVVLTAVHSSGFSLGYASAELRADREVVLAAVQRDGYALSFAPAELQADRAVVLAAVQQDGDALRHAPTKMKRDREVVLAAVQQNGYALCHASAGLRADREVVLAAVQQNTVALRYASAQLQRDGAVLKASKHMFADLDRLADRGQMKVLRTLASVQECGRRMDNCLANYGFTECRRHILVKLDGDDGVPLAVGSFANGEWEEIRYPNNGGARRGGSRACARGRGTAAAALRSAGTKGILGQFNAFLPALLAFQLDVEASRDA